MGLLTASLACFAVSGWVSLIAPTSGQFVLLNNTYFENNVSAPCSKALTAQVNCPIGLTSFAFENYFGSLPAATLDGICAINCTSSLSSYRKAVASACKTDPQPFNGFPATYAGDFFWGYQNITCKKDSQSNYCMNVISNWTIPANQTQLQQLPKSQLCSSCLISVMTTVEKTSFSDYDAGIASQWAAAQKICSISYPTTTQPPAATNYFQQPVNNYTAKGAQTCQSNNMYTVSKNDTCNSISIAKRVATGTLQALNAIYPDCSNIGKFVGTSICLPPACNGYVVQTNDTCWTIAYNRSMTFTQFLSYNPTIYDDCTNLEVGSNICLMNPMGTFSATTVPGATVTRTYAYASSTVNAPGPTPSGTTKKCGEYYQVVSGDTCASISLNQTVSPQEFGDINPSINSNCTNLQTSLWYCVFPVLGWNTSETLTSSSSTATGKPVVKSHEERDGILKFEVENMAKVDE